MVSRESVGRGSEVSLGATGWRVTGESVGVKGLRVAGKSGVDGQRGVSVWRVRGECGWRVRLESVGGRSEVGLWVEGQR